MHTISTTGILPQWDSRGSVQSCEATLHENHSQLRKVWAVGRLTNRKMETIFQMFSDEWNIRILKKITLICDGGAD